jgi:hypothetical protein
VRHDLDGETVTSPEIGLTILTPCLTQAELARRLGLSRTMVSRLVARGMPLDEAGAREWRQQHLSPMHTKAMRVDGNPGGGAATRRRDRRTLQELIELAEGVAQLMMDTDRPHLFDEGLPNLRGVMCAMPKEAFARVLLPVRCWDALTGWSDRAS